MVTEKGLVVKTVCDFKTENACIHPLGHVPPWGLRCLKYYKIYQLMYAPERQVAVCIWLYKQRLEITPSKAFGDSSHVLLAAHKWNYSLLERPCS